MGVGRMGKVETLGLLVAMAGALGTQSADAPPEAQQISTPKQLIQMSRIEFAEWGQLAGAVGAAWLPAIRRTP